MSVVVILSPVITAHWPALGAAIIATAEAAGFAVRDELAPKERTVALELENAEVVTGALGYDQQIVVEREGVRVIFSRDARGHFKTCVSGLLPDAELRRIGADLAGQVVQRCVYQRLTTELQNQGFVLLREEKGPDQSIRLQVRRYE